MTMKELIATITHKELLNEIREMKITTYLTDTLRILEIYNEIRNSTSTKKGYTIEVVDTDEKFPMAMKKTNDDRTEFLSDSPEKIVNCNICNKTKDLSDTRIFTFLILYFTALSFGEIPYNFLEDRYKI